MSKETQIMNGADAPEKGSKMSETTGGKQDQFPGSKESPEHKPEAKSTHRILSFKEFMADKFEKFNKQTIEKDAMEGPRTGDKAVATLESEGEEETTQVAEVIESTEEPSIEEVVEAPVELESVKQFTDFIDEPISIEEE